MDVATPTLREGSPAEAPVTAFRCRSCDAELAETFVDLGLSPLANAYPTERELSEPETFYPLRAWVCGRCFLVQLPSFVPPEVVFADYAYFSSYSESWLEHANAYAEQAVERFGLDSTSRVVEIASNDGYLLRYFKARGVPVLGIEPARTVAEAAQAAGIRTLVRFFDLPAARELVAAGEAADLVVANNVLAHVPDLRSFVAGVRVLLEPAGVATLEFPHLLRLIERAELDTIYHEHLSYFSLLAVERLFERCGLAVVDVEELATHGGSLRVYARHAGAGTAASASLERVRDEERRAHLDRIETYSRFQERARRVKRDLLEFLIAAKRDGKTIVGYGAPAKATTLLNYCGIRRDFVDYVVDRNPVKQGRFVPGVRLPIRDPSEIARTRPDYLLVLPWNIKEEIIEQMAGVREFGCRFVVPIPWTTVHD